MDISVQSTASPTGVDDKKKREIHEAIEVHQRALDDLVNANSIFTLAVFIGLSAVQPGDTNLGGDKKCNPGPDTYNKLIVNEVLSFSVYLLSSLVAKGLKTHLYTYYLEQTEIDRLVSKLIRGSVLSLSTCGSILGCIYLTLSMVDLIEIRLGKMSCRNTYTLHASGALIALVTIALTIYVIFMMHAIYTAVQTLEKNTPKP